MSTETCNYQNLEQQLDQAVAAVASAEELEALRLTWLGKEGILKAAFAALREVPTDQKGQVAASLNACKQRVEDFVRDRQAYFADQERGQRLQKEFIDCSLPGNFAGIGKVHPLRLVERRIEQILSGFGFQVVEGPEIETEYYCFDALNIPKHHPARDMQDTFYTDTGHLLRTHTTSVQARVLEQGQLPVKIISAGRVYRNETEDSAHQAMFHQYDLVWIDKGITLSHLMAVLSHILKALYGRERRVRFVSKFYPYTCPSIGGQIDCALCSGKGCSACKGSGWVTIVGAGMVHENVLREFNYDPKEVGGMAFGLGTSRLASQFYQAPNLKILYDSDLRYLKAVS
jgi:phenylalanyl-tRNA synthetase alpha chain